MQIELTVQSVNCSGVRLLPGLWLRHPRERNRSALAEDVDMCKLHKKVVSAIVFLKTV